MLEQRQQHDFTGTRDLVQLMLEAHEEQVDGVSKLSDHEIMAQSLTFLVAGFETTGITTCDIRPRKGYAFALRHIMFTDVTSKLMGLRTCILV